ncbi:hypothetical protein U1Q18_007423, partial [Sarracenia purpurea var. burkii]
CVLFGTGEARGFTLGARERCVNSASAKAVVVQKDITESGVAGDDGGRCGPVTRGQCVEAAPASEGGEMRGNGDRMVGQWHHNGEEVDGGRHEDGGATWSVLSPRMG